MFRYDLFPNITLTINPESQLPCLEFYDEHHWITGFYSTHPNWRKPNYTEPGVSKLVEPICNYLRDQYGITKNTETGFGLTAYINTNSITFNTSVGQFLSACLRSAFDERSHIMNTVECLKRVLVTLQFFISKKLLIENSTHCNDAVTAINSILKMSEINDNKYPGNSLKSLDLAKKEEIKVLLSQILQMLPSPPKILPKRNLAAANVFASGRHQDHSIVNKLPAERVVQILGGVVDDSELPGIFNRALQRTERVQQQNLVTASSASLSNPTIK